MTPKPKCIITGCDLVAANEGKWTYGPHERSLVMFIDSNDYFERRGVIVFDKTAVTFSDEARDYMKT